jgi:hypothetical protein
MHTVVCAEAELALKLAQDDHRAGEAAIRADKRGETQPTMSRGVQGKSFFLLGVPTRRRLLLSTWVKPIG